jgi:hypothetical protein
MGDVLEVLLAALSSGRPAEPSQAESQCLLEDHASEVVRSVQTETPEKPSRWRRAGSAADLLMTA